MPSFDTPPPKLGLLRLTLLVAGNIVGSGVFLLPATLAHYGSISLLAWCFTALGAVFLALVFARLSSVLPHVDGFYTYCRDVFGEFIGFQVAYNYWMALWIGNAGLVIALTSYLGFFWPALLANEWLAFVVNISIVWSLTGLNCLSVRFMTLFQTITTLFKLIPLLVVAILGIAFVNGSHFTAFNLTSQTNLSAFNEAATLTLWSFLGLESASLSATHTVNPKKNIPRATILGVILSAVLYIGGYTAIIGIIPFEKLSQSMSPYADAMQILLGNAGSIGVAALTVLSCLSSLSGWVLLQGQIPLAAARDGLFPTFFLKQNKQHVPVHGLIVSSILISILLSLKLNQNLVTQFTFFIQLATLASLIPYFFTVMAAFPLLLHSIKSFGLNHQSAFGVITMTTFAALYAFWAIIGAGEQVVFYGFLLFLTGIPLYVLLKSYTFKNKNGVEIQPIVNTK